MRFNLRKTTTNSFIVIGYFSLYFFLLKGVSGGDIFLLFLFVCSIIIHFVVLLFFYHKSKVPLWKSIIGLLLGVIIAMGWFVLVDNQKKMKKPEVEIGINNK